VAQVRHERNEKHEAIRKLGKFVKKLVDETERGDKDLQRSWRKKNERFMERCFNYKRSGGMPSITNLVRPFFHPTLPLVGLNYSPLAHNVLHKFPEGWTLPLRLCRGIVFNYNGDLVALAFEKFFNYGEHPETTHLPNEPFTATLKHDGHLGIIFWFGQKLVLTTRGSFVSPSSILGTKLLADYAKRYGWIKDKNFPKELALLVEMIHPHTKVHVDYKKQKKFILIGSQNRETLEDYSHQQLQELGDALHLPVSEQWSGNSIEELRSFMNDMSVQNREGYVVRFENGLRVKFKFATYINRMVEAKLDYSYLMNRIMSGNLQKMIGKLEEEILAKANAMVADLMRATQIPGSEKERREYLYRLVPKDKQTSSYKAKCRKFLKTISK
jgi:RNA ligase